MGATSPIVRFVLGFAVIYGLLLAPWPGANGAYARFLRRAGTVCFAREEPGGIVRFRAAEHPPRPEIDTEIVLVPPGRSGTGGEIRAQILQLDARGVGWVPTALVAALVLASPVPGQRRLVALVAALGVVEVYVLSVVAVFIWQESAGTLPVGFLPYSATLGSALEETLVTLLGASFVIPVLVWIAVTFRGDDWKGFFPGPKTATEKVPEKTRRRPARR